MEALINHNTKKRDRSKLFLNHKTENSTNQINQSKANRNAHTQRLSVRQASKHAATRTELLRRSLATTAVVSKHKSVC